MMALLVSKTNVEQDTEEDVVQKVYIQLRREVNREDFFYLNSSLEFFNVLAELLFAFLFVFKLIGNSVDLIFELQFLLLAFLLSLQLAFFVLTNVSHTDLFAEVGENSGMKRKMLHDTKLRFEDNEKGGE